MAPDPKKPAKESPRSRKRRPPAVSHALVTGLVGQLTERGRVVVVSSAAHTMAAERGLELGNLSGEEDYHPWRMYARSKLANILFARALSRRLGAARTANALHPGIIETNLGRHVPNAPLVR